MKANQLRIGNLVAFSTNSKKAITVLPNTILDCYQCEIAKAPYQYEPIPLTEEWLLKLGLIMDDESKKYGYSDFENAHIFIRLDENSITMRLANKYLGRVPIKHVHQLQNLYFALTGEELTFKL